jgi:hypothetical protein
MSQLRARLRTGAQNPGGARVHRPHVCLVAITSINGVLNFVTRRPPTMATVAARGSRVWYMRLRIYDGPLYAKV